MFQVGDTILYGANGVCKIKEITDKTFGENKKTYYCLQPLSNENTVIYAPVNCTELTSKMRRVLSAEEVHDIIRIISYEEPIWYEDEAERKEKYHEIISDGDRINLGKMIKALYFHQQKQQANGKKLHQTDERFFKEAERILYEEFAVVLHINPEEVLPYIMTQLERIADEKGKEPRNRIAVL